MATYLDVRSIGHAHHGQASMTYRLATPALPRVPLLQRDIRNGARSGLTAHRRRVLTVAHIGQQDWLN